MGKKRYAARGVPGGWRIWNNKMKKWWGDMYERQPDDLVNELNNAKRPNIITELLAKYRKDKR